MTALNYAQQQMVGFFHAKSGYSIVELIRAMGLTKKEWKRMKEIYKLQFISTADKKEIDDYFKIT